ncbi:hypothetical protein ACFV97_24600 [Streptomyces sp. NPDC059913]|uniref:hypothetical protein n=1 Tax=unclassified Streptomyces TaxID=2593676 RepID=UPI00364BB115
MSGNRRKAFLVSAVLVGGAMLMTACEDPGGDGGADSAAPQNSASAAASSGSSGVDSGQGSDKGNDQAGGSGTDGGTGRGQVGQVCGANDLTWGTRTESQAGGYLLITAKAKPGITCFLPANPPTVAFGSDGTEAKPFDQAPAKEIKLSGTTTAYAGMTPKTTNTNGGLEIGIMVVATGESDANPETLNIDTITVDSPAVTNWHTSAEEAVPVGG